jgi:hypothetical protein
MFKDLAAAPLITTVKGRLWLKYRTGIATPCGVVTDKPPTGLSIGKTLLSHIEVQLQPISINPLLIIRLMEDELAESRATLFDKVQTNRSRVRRGVMCLIGGFFINLVAGILNSWGTFTIYITSYLHAQDSSVDLNTMFITFPVSIVFLSTGFGKVHLVVGTILYHKIGARATIAISGSFITLSYLVCSFITNAYAFAIIYGMCVGFGAGCGSFTPVWPSWLYFPKRRGLATGIIMFGFGFGACIFGLAFTFLTNPNNEKPDVVVGSGHQVTHLFGKHVADNVPWTLRYLAFMYGALTVAAVLLVSDPTVSRVERKTVMSSFVSAFNSMADLQKVNCPSRKVAVRTWAFWDLLLALFFTSGYGFYIVNQYKNYGQKHIKNDLLLSAIGSVGYACNSVHRLLLTQLMDHFTFRQVMLANCALQIACAFTINLVVDNPVLYCIWVSVSFMCYAGGLSPFAVECGVVFGHV